MTDFPTLGRGIPVQAEKSVETKIFEAGFGDGYTQRAPAGLNNIKVKWTLEYKWLTNSDYTTLIATLEAAQGSSPLGWAPPGEVKQYFIVRSWNVTGEKYQRWSIRITLEKVFDL